MVNIRYHHCAYASRAIAWHRGITAPIWDDFGIIYQQGSVIILLDKLTENDIMIDR